MSEIGPALWLSLQIASAATLVALIAGVPLAYGLARRRFRGKSVIEALILVPMVLPPTVVGYLIIMAFGSRGWLSPLLGGYSIVFRFEGAVLAAAVVAVPMLYLSAKAGFATVERELEDIAVLMGANRLQLFWHVSLPLARRGLASGVVLAFARALGEFGATITFAGSFPGVTRTLPIASYLAMNSDPDTAIALALVLLAVSLGVLLALRDRWLPGTA